MKQVKSLLALSILAGGIAAASAANTDTGATLLLDLRFATNARPSFIEVSDTLPKATVESALTNAVSEVYVETDGAGKIEGAGWVRLQYKTTVVTVVSNVPTATNYVTTAFSDYVTDITGKVSTKGTTPNAQMTIKGNGYSSSVSPTNWNSGINQVQKTAGQSRMNLKFTSTGTAVVLNTNDNRYYVTGTYKGSISPGIDAVNNGKTIKVDEAAALRVRYEILDNLDLAVVSYGKKFSMLAGEGSFVGSGSVNSSSKYNASLKGIGSTKGGNLKLTGSVGNQTIIIAGETNVVVSLTSADVTGKAVGQKITGSGTIVVPANF